METQSFTVPVLVSVVTGTMLTNSFSDVHKCAEYVMGHPIWTHEFASKPLWELMRAKLLEQHPDLDIDLSGVTKDNWEAFRDDLVARLGGSRKIARGEEERPTDPVTSLRSMVGDKPIVAIDVSESE